MLIRSVMTKKVVTVEMDDSLLEVQRIFANVRFHHLLVIENDRLVGIISDRDLFKALSPFVGTLAELPRDATVLKRKAHQIMSRNPVGVSATDTVDQGVALLFEHGLSCLPVVSEDGKVEGIVTWQDLLRAYYEGHRRGETA